MPRVLHLITTLQAGGAQTMLANLVTAGTSESRASHVVVELTRADGGDERLRRAGIPQYSLGMTRGRMSLAAVGRLARLLRRERPAIVQTWLYHADLLGLLALPILRVPLVWNVRSAWHVGLRGVVPRICARLSRLPAAVVVNSRAGQAVHEQLGYRPRRWCLIANGFDLERFKPDEAARCEVRRELGLGSDCILIGIVGRWDPNKDHATFLAAAERLSRERDDIHFVMVGQGLARDNAELSPLIDRAALGGHLHLLGKRSDICRLTAALDIACCTSIGEGFPNVVGEAMAAGVPCVTTDVGDAAQLVADSRLVVPARDPAALAAAWLNLLSMAAASRRAIGLAGRARIAQYYALSDIVCQYEKLYQELACPRQTAP